MLRTSKIITISLMPDFLREIEKVAKEEKRTKSELVREALRRYLENRKWTRVYRYGLEKGKDSGFTEADMPRLVREYRKEQRRCKKS